MIAFVSYKFYFIFCSFTNKSSHELFTWLSIDDIRWRWYIYSAHPPPPSPPPYTQTPKQTNRGHRLVSCTQKSKNKFTEICLQFTLRAEDFALQSFRLFHRLYYITFNHVNEHQNAFAFNMTNVIGARSLASISLASMDKLYCFQINFISLDRIGKSIRLKYSNRFTASLLSSISFTSQHIIIDIWMASNYVLLFFVNGSQTR